MPSSSDSVSNSDKSSSESGKSSSTSKKEDAKRDKKSEEMKKKINELRKMPTRRFGSKDSLIAARKARLDKTKTGPLPELRRNSIRMNTA